MNIRNIRPLGALSRTLCNWARRGNVQTTVAHSGRVRAAVDSFGIALGWMSRGYQYDTRTLRQRLADNNARYHLRDAVRALRGVRP